ncbi:MAG: Uma2 family endonuclease [Rhodocyclaceae bacterium]|nr:Uma2 family endonuclease [Rhodocyclaceae bacterium]MBX3668940.1 Uma2 family endonuclease [Rhodocyclaceae bacterium]
MGLAQENAKFDAGSYLAWEQTQPDKHEYLAGEVYAMVGARLSHVTATGNLFSALHMHLRGSPCRAYASDAKVRIDEADAFFYPDVVVTCDPRDRTTPQYLSHPCLIVEVLSDGTAAFDRGAKFAAYRKLPDLREYGLIDLAARRIEIFRRNAEQHWVLYEYGPGEALELESVGLRIAVDELLRDTEEPPEDNNV